MSKIRNNTVVWITGASSGIGEELAYQINNKGAKVIISARREEELERVKKSCRHPENCATLTLDLGKTDEIPAIASKAENIYGKIDILYNNGGISQRDKAINTDLSVDRKIMEVNYFGTIALTKAVLKGMVERKSGHIVITSSAVGIISTPLRSAYSAAKHALHGFFDALRSEHHEDNIKITIACPGFIKTNISLNALTGEGKPQGKMDKAQANGMTVQTCVRAMIKATESDKEEVYIGGLKEKAGIYVKRFFPTLFSKMVRKMSVT